ncbi:AAA family ATPase [Streptomyces sp. SID13031]|uniref:AAA family ATPase n=1 Tax=Streptomyces sp. SID13031 TaxID=2706046 RepID=UPI0013C8399D|nr:AAA family ATPase [Streptomyces sp. SID13031]NEA34493.1 AAA family ATPase [Streptomyces sp. SID13031]
MKISRITELRLRDFKSYRDATIPLEPLTILIGRNGSGKSNALDAIEVLAQLAKGEEVRDALEGGRRESAGIRGGAEGCAAHGADSFRIGATIELSTGAQIYLDVEIQVRPDVRIVSEDVWLGRNGNWTKQVLRSVAPHLDRGDIEAAVWNGKKGRNPVQTFRSSHLLAAQLILRTGTTKPQRQTFGDLEKGLAVLAGVFHLDPVPHLMRGYVPTQDSVLRRAGDNLSAAVARLKHDNPAKFAELLEAIKQLPENEIRSVELGRGGFGDVMLALKERKGRQSVTIPARQMSDGMLRMMAIATAALAGGAGLDLDSITPVDAAAHPLCLVIEELENGLHASQAAMVFDLVKRSSRDSGFQLILTTHSPALLDALEGDDHGGVLLCEREPKSGASKVVPLVQLPGYLSLMAQQSLGQAVTSGLITKAAAADENYDQINRLLGIG